jgi:hypothetical protein
VKVNTEQKYRINIENTSPIQAEILVKNSKNKRLNFQTLDSYFKSFEEGTSIGKPNLSKTTNGN